MSGASVLVVDDEVDIRTLIQEILSDEGYAVRMAADAEEARRARADAEPDLVLLDIWMPGTDGITLLREWSEQSATLCPVIMMSGHGTVDTAVEATRLGAVDFIEKPLSLAKLLRAVESGLTNGRGPMQSDAVTQLSSIAASVGRSRLTRELRDHAQQIAGSAANVLIAGESGSGRESVARSVHDLSGASDGPFVSIAGGLLDQDNAAEQLFAQEPAGLLRRAQGGTLFVGELSDLGERAQKLLAATLEQGSYRSEDGREHPLQMRVMASVVGDYERLANEGGLRRDLLASINVMGIKVPALREYAEDLPDLLRYYVDLLVEQQSLGFRRFGIAAQNRLRNYPWPGNLASLRNLVQRCLIAGGDEEVSLQEVESQLSIGSDSVQPLVKQDLLALPLREAREQFERAYLVQQLQLCDGKVGKLAKRVGMERTHLYRKLRSLGIDFRQASSSDE
ncbi:MAG: sigma-54 dependent transcriptional regulator [Pseudomonadota bacterium]